MLFVRPIYIRKGLEFGKIAPDGLRWPDCKDSSKRTRHGQVAALYRRGSGDYVYEDEVARIYKHHD